MICVWKYCIGIYSLCYRFFVQANPLIYWNFMTQWELHYMHFQGDSVQLSYVLGEHRVATCPVSSQIVQFWAILSNLVLRTLLDNENVRQQNFLYSQKSAIFIDTWCILWLLQQTNKKKPLIWYIFVWALNKNLSGQGKFEMWQP